MPVPPLNPEIWGRADPGRYERIGVGYCSQRVADPHIEAQIAAHIGAARHIVNVGAGTGSYEPGGPGVVAVEPSVVMIAQRSSDAAPVVRASAESLPFPDQRFEVALALMTVHHWSDQARGLAELVRVATKRIVFTYDPCTHDALWLFNEYLPMARGAPGEMQTADVVHALGGGTVEVVPVPADCTDGFAGAYWRRPERYLDEAVRASMSVFARLGPELLRPGLARLAEDLRSGRWAEEHADLLDLGSLDLGLRLIVSP